jgi:sigma-E factor negative regulatory protein RseA
MIGDALRGGCPIAPGFAARLSTRLADEPTVLAPRAAPSRPVTYAWAVAAGMGAVALVGWVAFATLQPEPGALAKAGGTVVSRAPTFAPKAIPADYLLAHQEYSPTMQIQGVGPYLNAVATPGADARQ